MSVVSTPAPALLRKRLTSALIAASLCTLLGACGNDSNDDNAAGTSTLNSTASPAENSQRNPSAVLPADPSSAAPTQAALTIRTPSSPASDAGATLSAAAPAPLAPPVIHTVD